MVGLLGINNYLFKTHIGCQSFIGDPPERQIGSMVKYLGLLENI